MKPFTTLRKEIPSQRAIESFIGDVLTPNHPQQTFHLNNLKDEVCKYFSISQEAANMKLADYGQTGHGNDGTFLDSMVGWAAYYVEAHHKLTKKVGPNTWAHVTNTLPVYTTKEPTPKFQSREDQAKSYAKLLRRLRKSVTEIEDELYAIFGSLGTLRINTILNSL